MSRHHTEILVKGADALRHKFDERGFVIERNLFSPSKCEELAKLLLDIEQKLLHEGNEKEHVFEKDESGNLTGLRCVHNLLEQDAVYKEIAKTPRILELVSTLMSPNLVYYRAIATLKRKSIGSAFPWHQDYAYWLKGEPKMIGIWIALKDATVENGCLDAIPGSHKWGVLPMENNDPGKPVLTEAQESAAIPMEIRAGDAIVFHSLLLHKSNPNPSDKDRLAIIFEYTAPEYRNGQHHFDRHCGWNPVNDTYVDLG